MNEWWNDQLITVAAAAIESLKARTTLSKFYVDPGLVHFFSYVLTSKSIPGITIESLDRPMVIKQKNEVVVVVGYPNRLIHLIHNIHRDAIVTFALIPVDSVRFKFDIMKQPFNLYANTTFCFPFYPRWKCCLIPTGSFSSFFLTEPSFETKSIKAAIASLAYIFGTFNRIYGFGQFSTSVAYGCLDALDRKLKSSNNNLIMLDRSIDLPSAFKFHESYMGHIEELIPFAGPDFVIPEKVKNELFKVSTPITSPADHTFETIALLSLKDAIRKLEMSGAATPAQKNIESSHKTLIQILQTKATHNYLEEVLTLIQENKIDPVSKGRILALHESPTLLFRALASLVAQNTKEMPEFARFVAAVVGIQKFARFCRIEKMLKETAKPIISPTITNLAGTSVGGLVGLFASVVSSGGRLPKLPNVPSYANTAVPISNDPQRWFVIIPGGMTAVELAQMRALGKALRPKDQFVFMPTSVYNGDQLMREIIES